MTRTTAAVLVAAAVVALPSTASASLGGSVATVETDRAQMKSALVRIARSDVYTVQETLTPTGTTIRQYYSANGVVFGVAWQGPWQPDLRQLFGAYFDPYVSALQAARKTRRERGRVSVDDGNVVVHITGHQRAFSGMAYVPQLLPAGVSPEAIQ